MRFRRRVVLPEPRKPVTIVTGMGAIFVVDMLEMGCWCKDHLGKMGGGAGASPVWGCPNIACLGGGSWD